MNYEQDIEIDETALDVEWLNQPGLMMKYARHSAQMRRELDEAKQNLDITKAEVDKDIREHPDKYKLEKITEGAIFSTILTAKKYQDTNAEYLAAKYESDLAQGAVNAFEQRKSALENLVKLNGQQYFAGPRVPHDISWERQQRQQRSNSNIATKMKRVPK
jgi:hypothetical protein